MDYEDFSPLGTIEFSLPGLKGSPSEIIDVGRGKFPFR